MKPFCELTAARIPVIVPGTLFWVENDTIVCELPLPLVPVYEIPAPLRDIVTELVPVWVNVIGEPVGVQVLPTAFEEQPASVP